MGHPVIILVLLLYNLATIKSQFNSSLIDRCNTKSVTCFGVDKSKSQSILFTVDCFPTMSSASDCSSMVIGEFHAMNHISWSLFRSNNTPKTCLILTQSTLDDAMICSLPGQPEPQIWSQTIRNYRKRPSVNQSNFYQSEPYEHVGRINYNHNLSSHQEVKLWSESAFNWTYRKKIFFRFNVIDESIMVKMNDSMGSFESGLVFLFKDHKEKKGMSEGMKYGLIGAGIGLILIIIIAFIVITVLKAKRKRKKLAIMTKPSVPKPPPTPPAGKKAKWTGTTWIYV